MKCEPRISVEMIWPHTEKWLACASRGSASRMNASKEPEDVWNIVNKLRRPRLTAAGSCLAPLASALGRQCRPQHYPRWNCRPGWRRGGASCAQARRVLSDGFLALPVMHGRWQCSRPRSTGVKVPYFQTDPLPASSLPAAPQRCGACRLDLLPPTQCGSHDPSEALVGGR